MQIFDNFEGLYWSTSIMTIIIQIKHVCTPYDMISQILQVKSAVLKIDFVNNWLEKTSWIAFGRGNSSSSSAVLPVDHENPEQAT